MNTNIYWPVYKDIESEIVKLSYYIHFNDDQLCVYSSKITDLILRAAIEIESISKELYKANGGTKTGNIHYDNDAIKYLNKLWKLDKKVVIICSSNCYYSNRVYQPFKKDLISEKKHTYGWNKAYQDLKHDRANYFQSGCVKHLFEISSALYILNLYYKEDSYGSTEMSGKNINENLSSDIFSIKIHRLRSFGIYYNKTNDFDECTYVMKLTDESSKLYMDNALEENKRQCEYITKSTQYAKFCMDNNLTSLDAVYDYYKRQAPRQTFAYYILGKEEHLRMVNAVCTDPNKYMPKIKYEAVLNRHCIPQYEEYEKVKNTKEQGYGTTNYSK